MQISNALRCIPLVLAGPQPLAPPSGRLGGLRSSGPGWDTPGDSASRYSTLLHVPRPECARVGWDGVGEGGGEDYLALPRLKKRVPATQVGGVPGGGGGAGAEDPASLHRHAR